MNIYQLEITLQHIKPPVWRRVQVAGKTRLDALHDIIQDVMGWEDCHLHQFSIGNRRYGIPDPDFPSDIRPEHTVTLEQATKEGDTLIYEYDFGDSWLHKIKVEKILPAEKGKRYPVCLAGKRACPPEDCGGTWGYQHMLEVLNDPGDEEHAEIVEWLGENFDPEAFDLDEINKALR